MSLDVIVSRDTILFTLVAWVRMPFDMSVMVKSEVCGDSMCEKLYIILSFGFRPTRMPFLLGLYFIKLK